MRSFKSLSVIGLVGIAALACDGSFSTPNGHPVPLDTRDASPAPSDTTAPSDTRPTGSDTRPSQLPGGGDTRNDAGHDATPQETSQPPGGNACEDDYYACTYEGDLEYCDRGEVYVADCASVCRDSGFAYTTGCGYDETYDGDVCWCDDDAGPSNPPPDPDPEPEPGCYGGWSCGDSDTLAYCDGQDMQYWSCDAFCRDEGYAFATGCGWDATLGDEACLCEDDACTSGADVCLGNDYLETCDGRGAVTVDCWEVCQDAGYDSVAGCGYDSSAGGDACFCENIVCGAGELTCSDGSCLDTRYVCDGVSDCSTGDDEWGCPATCVEGDSWCTSGYELEVCDGGETWVYDCDDFCRDEGFDFAEGCGYDGASGFDACYCAFEACASWEFQCDDGLCLGEQYTCDGYLDCNGGEDEYGCF